MTFAHWDDQENGTMRAGAIRRVSESTNKTWGEVNATGKDLLSGTFVAINPDGGIKPLEATTEIVHGIIVRGVYGDKCPNGYQADVGHFSHGDEVVALGMDNVTFKRGDRAYVIATGDNAGKVTNVADGNIDLGYWITEVSAGNNTVAITLAFNQTVSTGGK